MIFMKASEIQYHCENFNLSEIRCEPPQEPKNGDIIGSDYNYGAQISFRCKAGYTMRGSDVATCLNNGQWDSQPPTCHGKNYTFVAVLIWVNFSVSTTGSCNCQKQWKV